MTIRPLLQHSGRNTDVPGVSLVVFNSPVAVHCIASGAPDPTERPTRHLAQVPAPAAPPNNQRLSDLKTISLFPRQLLASRLVQHADLPEEGASLQPLLS